MHILFTQCTRQEVAAQWLCQTLAAQCAGCLLCWQDRNMNHPDGGPEASRMTASARRKLGTLGTSLDQLFRWLDSSEAASL